MGEGEKGRMEERKGEADGETKKTKAGLLYVIVRGTPSL